jgi:hypothetical protein
MARTAANQSAPANHETSCCRECKQNGRVHGSWPGVYSLTLYSSDPWRADWGKLSPYCPSDRHLIVQPITLLTQREVSYACGYFLSISQAHHLLEWVNFVSIRDSLSTKHDDTNGVLNVCFDLGGKRRLVVENYDTLVHSRPSSELCVYFC